MAKIFDTLTAKLADLKQVRRDTDTAIEHVERYLRMGASWVNEREAEMAEMFAHLFPAAYAEPLVDVVAPPAVLDENLAIGKVIPLMTNCYQTFPTDGTLPGLLVERREVFDRRCTDFGYTGAERRSGEIRRRADYEERRLGADRRLNRQIGVRDDERRARPIGSDRRVNPQLFKDAVTIAVRDPSDAETFAPLDRVPVPANHHPVA